MVAIRFFRYRPPNEFQDEPNRDRTGSALSPPSFSPTNGFFNQVIGNSAGNEANYPGSQLPTNRHRWVHVPVDNPDEIPRYIENSSDLIQGLYIGANLLSEEVMMELENVVTRLSAFPLQNLEISQNSLSVGACQSLGHLLTRTHTLRSLMLPSNHMNLAGFIPIMEAIANPDIGLLSSLDLSDNDLGPRSDERLAQLLRSPNFTLYHLQLARNALGARSMKKIAPALCRNHTLTTLDLSQNQLGNSGLAKLATVLNPKKSRAPLFSLNISTNKIGSAGVFHLVNDLLEGKNRTLQHLDISINKLDTDGAECLAVVLRLSHTLRSLNISCNNIGDRGVELIADSIISNPDRQLQHLDLSWNAVTCRGAKAIANLLQSNGVLSYLNLGKNAIADDGMSVLATALQSDMALATLDMEGNQLRDAHVVANLLLATARDGHPLQNFLYNHNRFNAEGLAVIQAVWTFRLNRSTWLGKCLGEIQERRILVIDWTSCSCSSGIKTNGQENNPSTHDTVNGNGTSHGSSFHINRSSLPERKASAGFCPRCRGFDYGDLEIESVCMHLARHGPVVRNCRWSGPSRVTEKGIQALAGKVLAKNAAQLQRLTVHGIRQFALSGAQALSDALSTNRTLVYLSLVQCHLTDQHAIVLAQGITGNVTLRRLSLQSNDIRDVGCQAVLQLLGRPAQRQTLISLNLAENGINDTGLDSLIQLDGLQELYLQDNNLTDRSALTLARAAMDCSSIHLLSLWGNRITTRGFQALRLFLPSRDVLESAPPHSKAS